MYIEPEVGALMESRYVVLAECYLEMAEKNIPDLTGSRPVPALIALDTEMTNLINLFNMVLATEDEIGPVYYRLFDQLTVYFNRRGLYFQPQQWAITLIEKAANETLIQVGLLNYIAASASSSGQFEHALTVYHFILEEFRERPQHPGLGVIHHNLSLTYWRTGDVTAAIQQGEQALHLELHHEHPRGIVMALIHLAHIHYQQGEVKKAFGYLHRAASIVEQHDDAYLEAYFTSQMAYLTAEYADPDKTESFFQRALRLWQTIDEPILLAETRFNYAAFLYALGQLQSAIRLAQESLPILEQAETDRATVVREALELWQAEFINLKP